MAPLGTASPPLWDLTRKRKYERPLPGFAARQGPCFILYFGQPVVHRFGDRKKVKIQRPVVRCAALHAGFLAVLLFLLYQPQGLRYCVIQAVA